MRLSINIDDGLLKAVMDGGGFKTKKAAIEAGLQLLSRRVGHEHTTAMRQHLHTLARYNLWATQKLLNEHIAPLSDADYRKDLGLFFKSIHGTLNHLLVGEHLLWFRRFSEGISPVVQLNSEVESDRAELARRLLAGASAWLPLIEGFSDDQLTGHLSYTTMRGAQASLPFVPTLMHVFNHATHHRGQITAALTMLERDCPELDMVYFLQSEQSI